MTFELDFGSGKEKIRNGEDHQVKQSEKIKNVWNTEIQLSV